MTPTLRLYLDEMHATTARGRVAALEGAAFACDRSCFYPGGGGQPCDRGSATFAGGETREVSSVRADGDGVLWHECTPAPPAGSIGAAVDLAVDAGRRRALSRHHTVLHILNTVALRDHDGWITGVQIGEDYSRIDFRLDEFSAALCAALEEKVNAVIEADRPLRAYYLDQREYRARDDLRRTLDVDPPVVGGRVRVVEIEGFDAQACGGTHVASTAELGRFSITRRENKGRHNKRLYVRLD